MIQMFDQLVEACNELTAALQKEAELAQQLKVQKSEIDTLKNQVRTASTATYPKGFQQSLYSYKGEIYLIQYCQAMGGLIAEKINFFQPPQA